MIIHRGAPMSPSAGEMVNVINGHMSRYAYTANTLNVTRVRCNENLTAVLASVKMFRTLKTAE
jgi:hypothetical protein